MGNQQEKPKGNDRVTSTEPPENGQTTRLSATFQRIAGPCDTVCLDAFQKSLFPENPQYAGVLYEAMKRGGEDVAERSDDSDLSKKQYITSGAKILSLLTLSDQMPLYFKVFTKWKDEMNCSEFADLLGTCYHISWRSTEHKPPDLSSDGEFIQGAQKCLFGSDSAVTCGDVTAWCGRHCPQILQKLHSCTASALCGNQSQSSNAGAATSGNRDVQLLVAGKLLLKPATVCFLSYLLPLSYIPASDEISGDPLAAIATIGQLDDIVAQSGWRMLYDGLSVSRFQHHVMAYRAPTVLLIAFTDHIYCVAIDSEWKEGRSRWGGIECKLIQLKPLYRVMQAGENMMFYNLSDRTVPKGMQFGKDARTTFLSIDAELHNVKHYGVEFRLHGLEVWGCGGPSASESQKEQQNWEHKEANKAKERKLKIDVDEWKDSPDRQLLEMGGVQTEHAER